MDGRRDGGGGEARASVAKHLVAAVNESRKKESDECRSTVFRAGPRQSMRGADLLDRRIDKRRSGPGKFESVEWPRDRQHLRLHPASRGRPDWRLWS